jgi:hypothetical protein
MDPSCIMTCYREPSSKAGRHAKVRLCVLGFFRSGRAQLLLQFHSHGMAMGSWHLPHPLHVAMYSCIIVWRMQSSSIFTRNVACLVHHGHVWLLQWCVIVLAPMHGQC